MKADKLFFIAIVLISGCASSPSTPPAYYSLYGPNAGKKINITEPDVLSRKLDIKRKDLESESDYNERKKEIYSDAGESYIAIKVTRSGVYDKVLNRANDYNGLVTCSIWLSPYGTTGHKCAEIATDYFSSGRFTLFSKFSTCSVDSVTSNNAITISRDEASKIGDIGNVGVAVYGKLVAPYLTTSDTRTGGSSMTSYN